MAAAANAANNNNNNNTGTGGKGTRPKRGKYRNYDRDSLVEAVKAVQRGEMSVHRAGSYYGVPHSTLEYKVKERHLMRPRKREPKPQPGLDDHHRLGGGPSSAKGSLDGTSSLRGLDKGHKGLGGLGGGSSSKSSLAGLAKNHHHLQQQQQQAQQAGQFATGSPNGGLGGKMPLLDSAAFASQLPYGAPFYWPHAAAASAGTYGNMPAVDFSRAQTSGQPDSLFASQGLMQRFQQEAEARLHSSSSSSSTSAGAAKAGGQSALPKGSSMREMAEQLYDGSGTNGGSFLDDIIRHSLDKKPGDLASHSTLFDHLLKGNLRSSAAGSASDDPTLLPKAAAAAAGSKRSATSPPLGFHPADGIKRERASPGASSTSSTGSSSKPSTLGDHLHHHHHQYPHEGAAADQLLAKNVESLMKLQENLSSMSAAHLQRTAMEELNGTAAPQGASDAHGSDGDADSDSHHATNHHGHGHGRHHQHHHHQQQHGPRGFTDDSS